MEKIYNHKENEKKIYQMWEKGGYFTPKIEKNKKPFSIIMPPPNVNGALHIGHSVFVALEDIMARYHRMKGEATLWLPGTDHGGIATQVVYEKELAKQGKTRFDLGREKFFKQTYDFSMGNKKTMEKQLRVLGASCDWTKEKFTLEPSVSKIVFYTFKKMYEAGLIYRGERIINWCPRCQTALSDLETQHNEQMTKLFFIKYPLKGLNKSIMVATTRPETMLGDSAVAVNPQDKRYKPLLNKKVEIKLPLTKRVIPLIADESVDPNFGTGAVKVTPGHSALDFEIGERHKLSFINIIGKDGKITKKAGKNYEGLNVKECRERVLRDLRNLGLFIKEEDHKHSVAVCERCKTLIEPLVSKQWFVKTKELAKPAIEAVKKGQIRFVPRGFEKIYFRWMENIRDWCISRQIWWGHRIPVWRLKNPKSAKEKIYVGEKPPKGEGWEQDPDTLDTWFSSGQWPFTTLLAQDRKNSILKTKDPKPKTIFEWTTDDFEYFYPTTVMETGWDILFFWVARMIMLGIYCTGRPPFKYVYLHGLVRDKDRQKMSKSKGNVIDPLGVVDLYGADALRMALVFGTGAGNDIIISEEKIRGQRKFVNKIWNATRFVLQQTTSLLELPKPSKLTLSTDTKEISQNLTKEDKEILKSLNKTIKLVTKNLDNFRFHQAAEILYHFFWHNFCDIYIEQSKKQIAEGGEKEKENTKQVLLYLLITSLKLLHPFIPFVTETIYQMLPNKEKPALIIENWPK